jgi:hypothetical protein
MLNIRTLYFFFLEVTYPEECKISSQDDEVGYTLKIFHHHLAFHRSPGQCNWLCSLLLLRFEERWNKLVIKDANILFTFETFCIYWIQQQNPCILRLDSVQTMIYIGLFIVEANIEWGELRYVGHIPKRIPEGWLKTMRRCWRRTNWNWAHFETDVSKFVIAQRRPMAIFVLQMTALKLWVWLTPRRRSSLCSLSFAR